MVLADDSVSRHHAELVPEKNHWVLHDRGSFNGTFVDGRQVLPSASASVVEGARIFVGKYIGRGGHFRGFLRGVR